MHLHLIPVYFIACLRAKTVQLNISGRLFSKQRPLEIASTLSHLESIFREMGCFHLCAWFNCGRKTVKCFQDDAIPFQLIPLQVIVFY